MEKTNRKMPSAVRIAAALTALALLIPIPSWYKDGGTVEYRAVLYSVTKRHAMTVQNGQNGFWAGTEVKILFFEVYNDVRFTADIECC